MTLSKDRRSGLQAWQDHVLAVACLIGCALIYVWPLISNLTTSIPGRPELPDVTEYVWSVGWVRYALTHAASLTSTGHLFVPFGADLRLHTQELLQSLMAFPFTGMLGVIGAYNFILLLTFLLNGILAYGLIYSLVQNPHAALLSAICLMLSGALVWHFSAGRLALPALWIVIAAVWCVKSLWENPHWLKGITLGLVLSAAAFSDLQILLFSVIWIGLLLVHEIFRARWKNVTQRHVLALGTAVLVCGIPFAMHYLPVLLSLPELGYATPGLKDMTLYSIQLSDMANAGMIPHIYGFDFLIGVIGAIVLFRGRGEYRFWTISSLIFLSLTLGPYLKPFDVPLPFALLSLWPPALQFRAPYRFLMPALIGWSVTMGFLLAFFLPRIRNRILTWGITLLVIGVRLWYTMELIPFETQTYPEYRFYHWVADVPGDFAILEVPFGIRSGLDRIGDGGEVMQYYQHIHGKRLLNGSVSRLPIEVFDFYRSHPALMFLAGGPAPEPGILTADFADVLSWSNTQYVIIHRSHLPREQAVRIELFIQEQPQLEFLTVENDLVVYRVK